ncbi:MAG: hypothetical protein ACLF0P_10290, partial [Thermoanaerobaculia bacterium]
DLAFTDTLPAGVVIASPSQASTTCGAGAAIDAPEGGGTITFSGGQLPALPPGEEVVSCEVRVDVTGDTAGVFSNASGDLTSNLGSHGNATADLTVAADRPGFAKSFAPDPVTVGQTSTLTFTVDNTANDSSAPNLAFTDEFPSGLVVADPANAVSSCGGSLDASPGSGTVTFVVGSVAAETSCTVSVDVVAGSGGRKENTSGELTSGSFGDVTSGKAGAVLQVDVESLAKLFTDDPVPPGGTVTLELTITNLDRAETLTDLAFTDDLDAALSGLTATGLPVDDPCGAGSLLEGDPDASTLSFTGGSLGPGESCTFSVTLQVPAGAASGSHTNVTSALTGVRGGEAVTLNAASDDLVVVAKPVLTKEFTDDPVGPGDTVTLEFTLTNTSSTSGASDIAFTDDLGAALPGLEATGLPLTDVCGAGSELAAFDPPGPEPPDPSLLTFTGGSLAAAGSPGDSCTFQVTLQVPASAPGGSFTNTTSEVTATVEEETLTGDPAGDDLQVVAAPRLRKEFTDDPVQPDDTVTLRFTLQRSAESQGTVTDIAFTDDLEAALSGLSAVGLPLTDVCGADSSLEGDPDASQLSFTNGTLGPGESCSFSVTLQVPAGAPSGNHLNTTSPVQALVDGFATESPAASDVLSVAVMTLTKEFVDDPVLPGGTVTLRFTVQNLSPSSTATDVSFTDDLSAVLSGLAPTDLPKADVCGTDSTLSVSGSTLVLSDGSLDPGTPCTFETVLEVPTGAESDSYPNVTEGFSATVEEETVFFPDAADQLVVDDSLLLLSKEFTDDPVAPGDTVTLQLTVENLASQAVEDVAFTDDLDAALAGLEALSLPLSDPCGADSTLSGDPDASNLSLTGGTVPAGGSCTFDVTLQVPAEAAADDSVNTTSQVTGTVDGLAVSGDLATDLLQIRAVTFTKAFDGPTTAGGEAVLTFTLTNLDGDSGVSSLGFTDDLDAVIPGLVAASPLPAEPCGAGSSLSGTSVLTLSGGSLAQAGQPGDSCTFGVTVQVPADAEPGDFPNTTSDLTSARLAIAEPATDALSVEPPPAFGKSFAPDLVAVGQVSTLTFTIVNTTSALAATDLAFADTLPAGLQVADSPGASTTCTGGTVTAPAGGGTISYSGGTVAAEESCNVQVDVVATFPGSFLNTSGELTSSSGSSGTASDTLEALATELSFEKEFVGVATGGGTVELVFTLSNGSASPATDIAFTDDLDAVVAGMEAVDLPEPDVCGSGSQLTGTSVITLTGGVLAPGETCIFSVTLQLPSVLPSPPYDNLTSPVTFDVDGVAAEGAGARASLQVSVLEIPTATEWGLLALASLLVLAGLWRLRG